MKRLLAAFACVMMLCSCAEAANPSFSSFYTNHFITNNFLIRSRLNPAQFDTNATSITITNAGGGGTTNYFNTIYVTNLYATNFFAYTTNYYFTNISVQNITVETNLYITTNTYVIVNGNTNDVGLWISTNGVLRPIASLYATNEFQIAESTGWTGAGTNFFSDDGTFQSVATINPTDGAIPFRLNQYGFEDSPWRLWWDGAAWDTNRLFFNTNLWVRDGITITAVGRQAGEAWISGGVTAFGQKAATEATTANGITAIGDSALSEIHTGFGETALGNGALEHSQGFYDTAGGLGALGAMVNGEGNTAFGFQAGYTVSDGQYNTFLGYRADTALGTITNGIAIGMNTVVTNSGEIVLGNTGNSKLIVPIPTWTGVGDKALTDDGTYKTFVSTPGTTINPTDSYIPFRTNATTFLNSPWYVVSTNVATDSQIIFGPGTTNVLYRSGSDLVYAFNNTNRYVFVSDQPISGGDGLRVYGNNATKYVTFGAKSDGADAHVTAGSGGSVWIGPSGASVSYSFTTAALSPASAGKNVGSVSSQWSNYFANGSYSAYGYGTTAANNSGVSMSHTGTNGVAVFNTFSAGDAGPPRNHAFQLGATNQFAIGDGWVQLMRGMTKAEKATITATNGMVVYQTDNTPGLRAYVNGAWVIISTAADP